MIKVNNLSKHYGPVKALQNVTFEAHSGEVLGLLGPNGAGKTTLMRILTGFLNQTQGEVKIDNLDVNKNSEHIQGKIGYLPENTPLNSDLNVYEQLEFAAMARGITGTEKQKAINNAAEICGLKKHLYHDISELSKGYRQRVGLAQALIHNPKILILDEPTTGLDPNQIKEIRDLIKELGKEKTIILSTHIMQEVEALCDRVILINKGEIAADDTPDKLKNIKSAGEYIINLTVKGPYTKIATLLKDIEGVIKVEKIHNIDKETHEFKVEAENDLRSEINKAVIKADYELLEIGSEKQSMEEAFHKLTT